MRPSSQIAQLLFHSPLLFHLTMFLRPDSAVYVCTTGGHDDFESQTEISHEDDRSIHFRQQDGRGGKLADCLVSMQLLLFNYYQVGDLHLCSGAYNTIWHTLLCYWPVQMYHPAIAPSPFQSHSWESEQDDGSCWLTFLTGTTDDNCGHGVREEGSSLEGVLLDLIAISIDTLVTSRVCSIY